MENSNNGFSIEIADDIAEGVYSNLAIIAHSTSEFVIDFARLMPNTPKAKVKSRIILNAEHAKRLLLALQENITKFEKQNGKIILSEQKNPPIPMNFGGMKGEA
ncbi:MAG: DUF3467 domain-containing protein [Paludibacteraceae bacterium]|jgi:hypothetical protein|nr:DUF3467 domain-containing protein [Paludibacteraceae bacterium]NLK91857.1 DUF3467 domain-containing protein [Bacteroidales bacterium]MBP6436278.1 DUF3467 domain-containing protein [Paludibacteraceae bacterium]MBP7219978.1 DUF3467 domain-containing protein [Paludibacteraceae bacterium]MBP8627256.1 DUF3467 domain-containing protein [Paludibacteraceae bacterium]